MSEKIMLSVRADSQLRKELHVWAINHDMTIGDAVVKFIRQGIQQN